MKSILQASLFTILVLFGVLTSLIIVVLASSIQTPIIQVLAWPLAVAWPLGYSHALGLMHDTGIFDEWLYKESRKDQ